MPLYEVTEVELVPFRRVAAGPDLYERQIEDLMWDNLEAFTGDALFRVARQPTIATGGRPDLVALDATGNVHVIEIKRDVARDQLAQCLEYAGWAKGASLQDLAQIYVDGPAAFFADWTEFTGTTSPTLVSRTPRLVLVASDVHRRTEAALRFLTDSDLEIRMLRVSLYHDRDGREFLDVSGDHEPEFASAAAVAVASLSPVHLKIEGRRVQISDLIDGGLLVPGDELTWARPRTGDQFAATVTSGGSLALADGRSFATPSRAAAECAGSSAFDGWHAWRAPDGTLLHDLRLRLLRGDCPPVLDPPAD